MMIFLLRKHILEKKIKREERRQNKKKMLQKDVDHLLDRINLVGYDGLSDSEKSRLYAASRDISKEKKKDYWADFGNYLEGKKRVKKAM